MTIWPVRGFQAKTGLTTAIDVVKTRIQIDPGLKGKSLLTAGRSIIAAEGPKGLLTGFGPTAVGYLLQGGAKFAGYEASVSLYLIGSIRADERKNGLSSSRDRGKQPSRTGRPSTWEELLSPSESGLDAVRDVQARHSSTEQEGSCSLARFFADILLTPAEATRIRLVSDPKVSFAMRQPWSR